MLGAADGDWPITLGTSLVRPIPGKRNTIIIQKLLSLPSVAVSNLKPYHHGDEWVRQGVHTVAKRNKSKIYFSHFFVFFSIVFVVMTMARDRCCQTILQKSTMVLGRGPCRRGEGEEGEREEGRGRRRRGRGGKEGNEEKVGRRRGGEMGEREGVRGEGKSTGRGGRERSDGE